MFLLVRWTRASSWSGGERHRLMFKAEGPELPSDIDLLCVIVREYSNDR